MNALCRAASRAACITLLRERRRFTGCRSKLSRRKRIERRRSRHRAAHDSSSLILKPIRTDAAKRQADLIAFGETIGPLLGKYCSQTPQEARSDGERAVG
jgi:hypothetical protein